MFHDCHKLVTTVNSPLSLLKSSDTISHLVPTSGHPRPCSFLCSTAKGTGICYTPSVPFWKSIVYSRTPKFWGKRNWKEILNLFNSVFPGHSQSHRPFNLDTAPALDSFAQIMGKGSKETLKRNHLIVLDGVQWDNRHNVPGDSDSAALSSESERLHCDQGSRICFGTSSTCRVGNIRRMVAMWREVRLSNRTWKEWEVILRFWSKTQ